MKKYPYTDSTDMVLYERKVKKPKKQKIWLACLSSAVAASIFTAGILGAGYYVMSGKASPSSQLVIGQQTEKLQASGINSNGTEVSQLTTTDSTGKIVLTVPQIAEKCGSSVVGVINKAKVQAQRYYDPFSGRYYYYEDPNQQDEMVEQGSGSGIIISDTGYIVTNQHVISGATEISVILNTGEEIAATLVGEDEKTDLAVLKIQTDKELNPAALGDSNQVQVGELAVAIGNPLGQEFAGTVTAGVVSAVNRTMTIDNRTYNLIQTDAAINSGNSGGALFNQYGEVIGINSIKLSSTGVEGIGFAIAISEAKPIIEDLMSNGYVTGRPLVGISVQETRYGLFIAGVSEGTGAAQAGLKEGDLIVKVEGQSVKTSTALNEIRDTKKPGDTLKFSIMRDGELIDVNVVLSESNTVESNKQSAAQQGR